MLHDRHFNRRGLANPYFFSVFMAFMFNFTIELSYLPLLIGGYTLLYEIYKIIRYKRDELSKFWVFFYLIVPIIIHYM